MNHNDSGNKLTIALIFLTLTVYSQQLSVNPGFAGYYRAGIALQTGQALSRLVSSHKGAPRAVESRPPMAIANSTEPAYPAELQNLDEFDGQIPAPVLTMIGQPEDQLHGAQSHAASLMEEYLAMDEEAFELDPEDIPIPEMLEDSGQDGREFSFKIHKVAPGDTLGNLAARYKVDEAQLALVNGVGSRGKLKTGQELVVPLGLGTVHSAREGETLWKIGKKYNLKVGTLLFFNRRKQGSSDVMAGEDLFVPLGVINASDAQVIASNTAIQKILNQRTVFAWPVRGRISSHFGWRSDPFLGSRRFHKAIDISAPYGTSIAAAEAGRVIYTGWRGTGGITVIIEHQNGMYSYYAHCSKILVRQGQWVSRRQTIARVGQTGRATGAHLHFALRKKNDSPVNPLKYLNLASL